MKTLTAINDQSVLDLSIILFGTLEGVMQLALLNGLSLTDELVPGQEIEVGVFNESLVSVLDFIKKNNIRPATGFTAVPINIPLTGIDYWAVGIDFVVQ